MFKLDEMNKYNSDYDFSEDEKLWLRGVVTNPIFEKVLYGLLLQSLSEEQGVFKRSLSPEEVNAILRYQNIYRDVLGDIKDDMLSYSQDVLEESPQDDEELPDTFIDKSTPNT